MSQPSNFMTICIAAIAKENGKEYIVLVTDHMITATIAGMRGEFDYDIKKYKFLDKEKNCVAMLAGNTLLFDTLTSNFKNNLRYLEYKEQLYMKFKEKRKLDIQDFLIKNEMTLDYIKNALLQPQVNPSLQAIIKAFLDYKLNTTIILTGIDENGKCQINQISEGGIIDFTTIGFHCIGVGELQASNVLLHNKQSNNLTVKETLYNIYKAKKYAQVSGGVGKETEMIIFSKDSCKYLTEGDFKVLDNLLEEESSFAQKQESLNNISYLQQ